MIFTRLTNKDYFVHGLIFLLLVTPALPIFSKNIINVYILTLFVAVYFLKACIKEGVSKEQKRILYALFAYVAFCSLSNFYAPYSSSSGLIFNLLNPLNPVAMVLWTMHLLNKYKDNAYKMFFVFMLIYEILQIATMILVPEGFREYEDYMFETERTYFIGSKFASAYFHLCFSALFIYITDGAKGIKNKLFLAAFLAYAISISIYMGGMTASTILVFMAIYYFGRLPKFLITNASVLLGFVVAISITLLFFQNALLNNSLYLYFVEDILGKDSHMTGRTDIYFRLSEYLLSNAGLLGIGTGYDFLEKVGCANLQNEVFQKLFQTGIGGVVSFFSFLYINIKYSIINNDTLCWFIALTAYLLASLVEVPFTGIFMIFITLIPKNNTYNK